MTLAPEPAAPESPSPVSASLPPGAHCPRHAERAASGVCMRCGDYVCGHCGASVDERLYCPSCVERLTSEHSPRALRALVLGGLSVHALFFLAPFALALAVAELRAIEAGESSRGGVMFAHLGLALGIVGLAIPVSMALLWLLAR